MDLKAVKDEELLQGTDMDIQDLSYEELLQESALRMAFSIVNPFLLKCALRLKIPDIIWKAGPDSPLSVQQIASQLPSEAPDVDALSRIVACLSTMGILKAIKPTEDALAMKYTLTNLTKTYFVSEDISPFSLAPLVFLQTHPALWPVWDHMHERVLHVGDSFWDSCGDGKDFWSYAEGNSEINDVFNAAMVSLAKVYMSEILITYDGFKDVNTLVDLGGGHGEVISQIIAVYPHIHAINFDLPHVIATAPILPGIKHMGGNMFESVPSGDAILMKHVLHLWDDEDCIKLLNMCNTAVSHKGKLIIVDAVFDIGERCDPIGSGHLVDIVMLNVTRGGRERTENQWNGILASAGFLLSRVVGRKGSPAKIIEAVKC